MTVATTAFAAVKAVLFDFRTWTIVAPRAGSDGGRLAWLGLVLVAGWVLFAWAKLMAWLVTSANVVASPQKRGLLGESRPLLAGPGGFSINGAQQVAVPTSSYVLSERRSRTLSSATHDGTDVFQSVASHGSDLDETDGFDGSAFLTPPDRLGAEVYAGNRSRRGTARAGESSARDVFDPSVIPAPHRIGYVDAFNELLGSVKPDNAALGWKFQEERDGVALYTRPMEASLAGALGIGVIACPVQRIADLIGDMSRRSEWDDMFKEFRLLENFVGDAFQAVWIGVHGLMLVSGRDFCMHRGVRPLPNGGKAIVLFSVERDDCPPVPSYVRATVFPSGFVLEPLDAQRTQVSYVSCCNVNGWIPPRVSRMAAAKGPMQIAALRRVLLQGA